MTAHPPTRRGRNAAEPVPPDLARRPQGTPPPLFDPAPAIDGTVDDPATLARAATLASGRAMRAHRWAEARALAGPS